MFPPPAQYKNEKSKTGALLTLKEQQLWLAIRTEDQLKPSSIQFDEKYEECDGINSRNGDVP